MSKTKEVNTSLIFNNVCKKVLDELGVEPIENNYSDFVKNYDSEAVLRIAYCFDNNMEINEQVAYDIDNLIRQIYESDFIDYVEDCAATKVGEANITPIEKNVYKSLLNTIDLFRERNINSIRDYDDFVLEAGLDFYMQFYINKTGFEAFKTAMNSYGLNELRGLLYNKCYAELLNKEIKVRKI